MLLRAFPARLEGRLYDELKRRSSIERRSMNTVLNDALDRQFSGLSEARAALLRVLAILDDDASRERQASGE